MTGEEVYKALSVADSVGEVQWSRFQDFAVSIGPHPYKPSDSILIVYRNGLEIGVHQVTGTKFKDLIIKEFNHALRLDGVSNDCL